MSAAALRVVTVSLVGWLCDAVAVSDLLIRSCIPPVQPVRLYPSVQLR